MKSRWLWDSFFEFVSDCGRSVMYYGKWNVRPWHKVLNPVGEGAVLWQIECQTMANMLDSGGKMLYYGRPWHKVYNVRPWCWTLMDKVMHYGRQTMAHSLQCQTMVLDPNGQSDVLWQTDHGTQLTMSDHGVGP